MKTRTRSALLLAALLAAAGPAHADLSVTTKLNSTTKITTQLDGSVLEAIVDGLQLAANVVSMIRSIASGDAIGVLNGAIGAYREALQLMASSGDRAASGEASVVLDPNLAPSARLTFRVVSNDDPLGAVRVAGPLLDGVRYTTPAREDFSDRGIGRDVSARVDLDLTRVAPGRYPFVFTTKETDCHQCLSVVHVMTVEVKRRCPVQGTCAAQRATYETASRTHATAQGAVRTAAATASRTYLRQLTRLKACLKNHANPSACDYLELAADGQCPALAFGATAADCTRIRNAQAAADAARVRKDAVWQQGVSMGCCLFGCTGGRADRPWKVNTTTRGGAN